MAGRIAVQRPPCVAGFGVCDTDFNSLFFQFGLNPVCAPRRRFVRPVVRGSDTTSPSPDQRISRSAVGALAALLRPFHRCRRRALAVWPQRQPFLELRPASERLTAANRHSDRSALTDDHHEPPAPGHARVEQIAPEHRVVLRGQRDHHGRVLRALRLVNRGRVGEHQLVELAEAVGDLTSVELDQHLAGFRVDRANEAKVAVVDVLVVVVLDLHHLVAGAECPAEALDGVLAGWVEHALQIEV